MKFTQNYIDLNNAYVLVKKFDNKLLFKAKNWAKHTSNAHAARIYLNLQAAQEALAIENANRKKVLYKIEPASKFFMNNWIVEGNNWNKNIVIKNEPVSIEWANENKHRLISMRQVKEMVLKTVADIKTNVEQQHKNSLRDLEKEFQHLEESKKRELNEYGIDIASIETTTNEILAVDFNALKEKLMTKAEITFEILYGKKD